MCAEKCVAQSVCRACRYVYCLTALAHDTASAKSRGGTHHAQEAAHARLALETGGVRVVLLRVVLEGHDAGPCDEHRETNHTHRILSQLLQQRRVAGAGLDLRPDGIADHGEPPVDHLRRPR